MSLFFLLSIFLKSRSQTLSVGESFESLLELMQSINNENRVKNSRQSHTVLKITKKLLQNPKKDNTPKSSKDFHNMIRLCKFLAFSSPPVALVA